MNHLLNPPKLSPTLIILVTLLAELHATPPPILSHQGRLIVDGINHDGAGYFKFALVDGAGTTTFWSHDGTSTGGGPPSSFVYAPISKGHYAVALGDTNFHPSMTSAIPAAVFAANDDVRLRIWFSTAIGGPFEQLAPDRRLTSTGYALAAARAEAVSDGAVTADMIADGAVTVSKLATSFQSSATQTGEGVFDLSDLPAGTASYSVTFDGAFPPGTTPEISLSGDWSLDSVSESGFTATRSFVPTVVDTTDDVGEYSSLAIVDGHPAIAYFDSTNDQLKFAHNSAADGTGSWTISVVDSSGLPGSYCSLAEVNGHPAISYYDSLGVDLKFARNSLPDGSGTWTIVSVDSAQSVGAYTSLAVVNGNPAIAYLDNTNSALKFARNSLPDGTGTWSAYTVDNSASVGSHTSLAEVGGLPAISYYDASNGDLKYALSSQSDGSGSWSTTTVDAPGNVGWHSSLAVVDGNPAISYRDISNGNLKFARSSAADGSGVWTSMAVDTEVLAGYYTSLKVINGAPAISYHRGNAGDLMLARASAPDGAGSWSLVEVDTVDDVGEHTSLAIVGGEPGISYHDVTNGDLKFARVPNALTWTAGSGEVAPIRAAGVGAGSVTGESVVDGSISAADLSVDLEQYLRDDGSENFKGQLNVVGGKVRIDNNQSYAALDSSGTLREMLKKTGNDETSIATAQNENILFRDGSNTNMVMTGDNGYFGVGDLDPLARLHVRNVDTGYSGVNSAEIYVEDTDAGIFLLSTEGGETGSTISLVEIDSGTGTLTDRWTIARETTDGGSGGSLRFNFNDGSTTLTPAELNPSGDLFLTGSVNPPSDRNVKRDFEGVDSRAILERVSALPITTWRYKTKPDEGPPQPRHIGPVAQDFHAAFGVGGSDRHISTVDADGVALAAIQGLNEKMEEENRRLRDENEAMRRRLERLERLISGSGGAEQGEER